MKSYDHIETRETKRTNQKFLHHAPIYKTATSASFMSYFKPSVQGKTATHLAAVRTQCCWTGLLFVRRLFLATVNAFVIDSLTKMTLMTAIMFLYLIDTIYTQPCKGRLANLADISSSSFLCVHYQ